MPAHFMGFSRKQHGASRRHASIRNSRAGLVLFLLEQQSFSMSDKLKEFNELYSKHEPLRPELRPFLEKSKFGWFIRHPFCNDMIPDLTRCAQIHYRIDRQAAKADACFENQDWEGYIGCVEVYSQLDWLAKDAYLLPDDKYWSLLGRIYGAKKFTHYSRDVIDTLFRADRPGRENLMDPDERDVLARLPDVLTVYRGYTDDKEEGYEDGIAWSLDRREGVWYANTDHDSDNPRLITGRVRKADVWAYCEGGDLLLPPEKVFAKRNRRAWSEKARAPYSTYLEPPFDIEAYIRQS